MVHLQEPADNLSDFEANLSDHELNEAFVDSAIRLGTMRERARK
jgi:hypothetical protein